MGAHVFLNQKIVSKLSEMDPEYLSRIRILIFFTHPGSRGQQGTGSRVRNTACAAYLHKCTYLFLQDIKMDTDCKVDIEGPEPVSPSPVKANGTSK